MNTQGFLNIFKNQKTSKGFEGKLSKDHRLRSGKHRGN